MFVAAIVLFCGNILSINIRVFALLFQFDSLSDDLVNYLSISTARLQRIYYLSIAVFELRNNAYSEGST